MSMGEAALVVCKHVCVYAEMGVHLPCHVYYIYYLHRIGTNVKFMKSMVQFINLITFDSMMHLLAIFALLIFIILNYDRYC